MWGRDIADMMMVTTVVTATVEGHGVESCGKPASIKKN
jgi:hypothetical protein